MADPKKTTTSSAAAGSPSDTTRRLPGEGDSSNTASESTGEPTAEEKEAIDKARADTAGDTSMPQEPANEAEAAPQVEGERVNFDHDANANLSEEQKGATTNKFGTQSFGDPKADKPTR